MTAWHFTYDIFVFSADTLHALSFTNIKLILKNLEEKKIMLVSIIIINLSVKI